MRFFLLNVEFISVVFLHLTIIATETAEPNDLGNPLILTPLLKNGNFTEARRLSEVPQILPNIQSNAGFFTIDETYNSNLFFWFFRKIGDDWNASPLLLWFYGGPGATFMHSVFLENGPFRIHKNKITAKKYSWVTKYNLLYIDQPVGTGFSFTNDNAESYIKTKEQCAIHSYNALEQFFNLYPELQTSKFYIACESYGCKFANAFAHLIHELKTKHKSSVNLCGIYMSSAFIDPLSFLQHSDLMHKSGALDYRTVKKIQQLEETAKTYVRCGSLQEACTTWRNILRDFKNLTFGLNHNNFMYENYGKDLSFVEHVNSVRMRKALHVGNLVFNISSPDIFAHLVRDHFKSEKRDFEKLLEIYPILFASGNLDILASPIVTQTLMRNLQWSGAETYRLAVRGKWHFGDKLIAYYVKSGNLLHVMMRDAGHMLSVSHPGYVLELLNKFILNEDFSLE